MSSRTSILVFLTLASLVAFSTALGQQVHEAAKNGDVKTLRSLIEGGVDVDSKDDLGRTPLHYAKDGSMAELLVSLGADVNARGHFEYTPLHSAASAAAAEVLIAHGADVHAINEFGGTPLHSVYDPAIVDVLVKHGADVNARSNDGQTVLHNTVGSSVDFDKPPVIDRLLAHGADINSRDDNGQTPLHRVRQREVAEILIAHGADVNAQDNDRSKPWDIAKRGGYEQLLPLLSEQGGHGRKPVRDIVLPVLASGLVTSLLLIIVLRLMNRQQD